MKRVLIVDDDRRTRRVLQILVERLALESNAFERAEDALVALGEESVALILTDLKMPGTDGLEFMRKLRELDERVPVIVLTAYGTVESAVEAMKLVRSPCRTWADKSSRAHTFHSGSGNTGRQSRQWRGRYC